MTGPSIVVRVLGDLKGLQQAFGDTSRQAQTASSGLHDAFSGVLGLLNQSGVLGPFQSSINTIDQAFQNLEGQAHNVSSVMLGLGGAFAGVGLGLSVLGSKDQAARQQLQAAIDATGQSWDDYSSRIDAAIKHQEKFGDSASQTQNALQVLTQATGDPTKALGLLGEATDLAAAKHEDLTSAASQLGKTYNGSTKLLKEFGIAVASTGATTKAAATATSEAAKADQNLAAAKQHLADLEAVYAGKTHLTTSEQLALRTAQEKVTSATNTATVAHGKATAAQTAAAAASRTHGTAVTELANKLQGQGSAAADTFSGKIKAITTTIEDQAAAFGNKYGPALQVAGQAVGVLGAGIKGTQAIMEHFNSVSKLTTDAEIAKKLAMLDTAVAADTEAASMTTADAASLPLIATIGLIVLAVAALAAIGYVIYRNWTTIWKAIKQVVVDVWDWIKSNWPYLLGILLGPFALAAAAIYKNWDSLVSFFSGLIKTIGNIFVTIGEAIAAPFRFVFNAIANLWNDTIGSLSFHIPSWIPGIGGDSFSAPKIPTLAQGGLITSDGLVYAHAGEAIIPAPAAASSGPAVQFTGDVHLHNPVDLESFTRGLAWMVQTQKI